MSRISSDHFDIPKRRESAAGLSLRRCHTRRRLDSKQRDARLAVDNFFCLGYSSPLGKDEVETQTPVRTIPTDPTRRTDQLCARVRTLFGEQTRIGVLIERCRPSMCPTACCSGRCLGSAPRDQRPCATQDARSKQCPNADAFLFPRSEVLANLVTPAGLCHQSGSTLVWRQVQESVVCGTIEHAIFPCCTMMTANQRPGDTMSASRCGWAQPTQIDGPSRREKHCDAFASRRSDPDATVTESRLRRRHDGLERQT